MRRRPRVVWTEAPQRWLQSIERERRAHMESMGYDEDEIAIALMSTRGPYGDIEQLDDAIAYAERHKHRGWLARLRRHKD